MNGLSLGGQQCFVVKMLFRQFCVVYVVFYDYTIVDEKVKSEYARLQSSKLSVIAPLSLTDVIQNIKHI